MKLIKLILSFFRKKPKRWNTTTISCSLDPASNEVHVRYEDAKGPVSDFDIS